MYEGCQITGNLLSILIEQIHLYLLQYNYYENRYYYRFTRIT
ncbi:hypothetical protein CLV33_102340 [Jejuia pallidilutea]|jgi:hypothetical protein|uniref:Uncharacterized protein n=1 Tax=Jejuia pallidilutea TaxID=504487 RepID=A0A362XCJ1_9FLAO|nr:hypothetical protein CLV33_102340 [Jejuia pallidilutea]